MAGMSEPDQIPVVGGPFDGQAYWFSSARFLHMPSAQDAVTVVRDGEALTLFGEHIYEMKCYAQDGEKSHRWEYVGYKPPDGR
jgi:hypothetical protein